MKYLPDVLLALATSALGIYASVFIDERNKQKVRCISGIVSLILGVAWVIAFCYRSNYEKRMAENSDLAFLNTCRSYIKNEDYNQAMQLLQTHTVNDAQSSMIYAYLLANGYGVEKDINKSIHYYSIAKDLGNAKAETNMVVSVVKNCATTAKVDVLRDAYENGNQMAEEYLTYVISSYNAKQSPDARPLTTETVWDLPEDQLLETINGPFYYWVGSNVTYNTSMSTSSTPTFTRKYLYSIGSKRVYEEMHLIADPNFPDWFHEDLW